MIYNIFGQAGICRWRGGSSEAQEDAAEENSENDNGSDMSSEADLDDSGTVTAVLSFPRHRSHYFL